jgi:hypothetical protein
MAFFVPDGVCNPVRNVYDRFNVNAKSLKRLLRADVCSRRFIAFVPDGVCNPVRNVYDRFNVNAKSLKRLLRADVCSRRFIAYQVFVPDGVCNPVRNVYDRFVPDGVCNPVRNVYDRFNVNAKSLKRLLRAEVCSRRFIAYQVAKATTTSRHSLCRTGFATPSVTFMIGSMSMPSR